MRNGAVFITGGSRGIGRAIALGLASKGTPVAVMARPSLDLDSFEEEASGSKVAAIPMDVSEPASVSEGFAAAAQTIGPPAALLTFAGSTESIGPLAEADPEIWWSAVAVDLRGTMLAAQAALVSMLPTGRGRIVTVYGNLGDHGRPNVSAFACAKAALARLTETLANELAGTGVIALGLHPGFVRTPMTEHLAWSDPGQQWLPDFKEHAEANWGNADPALTAFERILAGDADSLAGRILYATDDVDRVCELAHTNPDLRRLRLGQP